MNTLPINIWTARAEKHRAQTEPLTEAFIKRRGLGKTHPVHDFLFIYYTCSPSKLKQWIPSFEENLITTPTVKNNYPWLIDYWFYQEGEILALNKERLQENTRGLAKFVCDLCKNILNRPQRFGCYGLHEWAMVYKSTNEEIRHQRQLLRISQKDLASFVESQTLCCTHYDAYRFFTKDAHPLNTLNPTLESRLEMEQGGCIHANMDIYKWATKLWPWIGSDFILKAFFHALEGRELDMRASPYDLSALGYLPIAIETESGRKEYQKEQQIYAEKTRVLREELSAFCERLSHW